MPLIIILTLQLLLVIILLTMLGITKYRLIWIITACAAGLMALKSILLLLYKSNTPTGTIVDNIISSITILVLLFLIKAVFVFYFMYKNRINLEKTLRQNEESAKDNLITSSAAVEQSPSMVVITDLNGNIEYVNHKFTELTGYEKDEVTGINPRILKSGYFSDDKYKEMWTTIISGKEWRGEFHNKKKNGDLYWESASISSIRDSDGTIKHFLAVKEDITERKKMEESLKKSEQRLLDVQRVANIGTWEWDSNKNKAFWSDENYRIMGFEPGEIEPSHELFQSFIHPDDEERVFKAADKSRANHKENNEIFRIILRDGTIKYVNDWSYYSYNTDGKFIYSTGMMQDITLNVENEKKLKSSIEEKNALLRELYHRTKNNMQVISAMLNLSASKLDNTEISEVFTDLNNRIQSMSLVHEKLYQSQNLSSINLKEYITDLCSSLKVSYHKNNCDVSFKFDLVDISILIDAAVPLGLIINELISNSFKHAFPGRAKGEIHISLSLLNNSMIKMEISDNGIGLSSDFNLDNLETLGLQTVYAIGSDQLHGNIELDTSSGFKFSLKFRNDAFIPRV